MNQHKHLSFVMLLCVGALSVACPSDKPAAAEAPPARRAGSTAVLS